MIYGIGVDVCRIDRMEKRKHSFFEKYYSEQEMEYCNGSYESLAGIFAAKEAYVKALGTGIIEVNLKAIEILHDPNGRPYYNLSDWAEREFIKRNLMNSFLSISHDGGIAEAFCVLERNDNTKAVEK